ncbi:MAG: hypothetical protein PVJ68_12730 [Candidatus Thiodiazotropha sp.]|jgi:hypothetical protein
MLNSYQYRAHFAGRICEECLENLANIKVTLYRSKEKECPEHPNIKKAFKQLSENELEGMQADLLAVGKTNDKGKLEVVIDPEKNDYQGECIEVVITLNRLVGVDKEMDCPEYFRLAYYKPNWDPSEQYFTHHADFKLATSLWCTYLRKHGVWVICGQVNTCAKPVSPVGNVTVKAFDVDWIQDDYLGSDVTDSNGRFKIYYDISKFDRTPFSPFINIEWTGGPDVYFRIEGVDADGNTVELLNEPPSRGRKADRENVPNCFCTKLCVAIEKPPIEIADSAWTGIGTQFTIPDTSDLNDFDAQGYAGSMKYAFTGVTRMTGQSLRFSNGNPIEYRFLVSLDTDDNGMPYLSETKFTSVVGAGATTNLFVKTRIGQMWRFSPTFTIVNIYAELSDLDADGWLDVNKSIERTFIDDPTLDPLDLSIPGLWQWVDLDGMIAINTANYIEHADIPDAVAGPGEAVPVADRLPIQKMAIRFETREVVDKSTNTYIVLPGDGMTLNCMVVNNNKAFMKLAMKEHLVAGACTPLSGDVHAVYTVSHPHLDDVSVTARKNSDLTATSLSAAPIPLVNNTNTSLDHINNSSGIKINDFLTMAKCTYIVKLHVRRRLHTGDSAVSGTHVDTSFYWEP